MAGQGTMTSEGYRSQDTIDETTSILGREKGWRGCLCPRYSLSILGCVGFIVEYCQRVNLSVAIVAMVKPLNASDNSTFDDNCPGNNEGHVPAGEGQTKGEFEWDRWTQGIVLGAFFWGYTATNLLGGLASEYLGGKTVMGLGIIVSSFFSLISPIAARTSVEVFIFIRIIQGAAQGVSFPAMTTILATWFLPLERSKFTTIAFSGFQIGTVIGMLGSGWLSSTTFLGGWPSAFYVFGVAGMVWGVLWLALVYERPEDHPGISKSVLRSLREHHQSVKRAERVTLRWSLMLRSAPLWALVVVSLGNDFGFYTLLTELPSYLHDVHHYDLASNGLMSALPYFLMWVWSFLWAAFMDVLSRREIITLVTVRRLSMAVAIYGPMCGLLVCVGLQCAATAALTTLCVMGMLNGAVNSGYLCSHQDLAPNLAGTIFGFTNTVGALTGIITPSLTGFILDNVTPAWSWRVVFLVTCVVYFITINIYIPFISASVQPWNDPEGAAGVANVEDIKNHQSPSFHSHPAEGAQHQDLLGERPGIFDE